MSTPNIGYATLTVIPSLRGVESSVKQQLGPLSAAGKDAGTRYGRGFEEGAKGGILSTQTTLAGLAAGGALAYKSIQGASALNETISKSRQVFGGLSIEVEKFGDTAAKGIGQSKQQAIDATATFGNLFTAMGIGIKPAEEMSISLVKLASDLASFNDTSPDDALLALRSGLSGEIEPLRRYGVNITEATLKQKAMQLGLSDGKGVLDANSKAQAAYALILEQTKTAQGDFARTADGLANKQRTATAESKNAAANLGTALEPAYKSLVDVMTVASRLFGAQPPLLTQVEVGAVALGLGYAKVVKPITDLARGSKVLSAAQAVETTATVTETQALGGLTVAEGEAAAGVDVLTASTRGASVSGTGLAGSLGPVSLALAAAAGGAEAWSFAINRAASEGERFKGTPKELANELQKLGESGKAGSQLRSSFGPGLEGLKADLKTLDSTAAGFASHVPTWAYGGLTGPILGKLTAGIKSAKGDFQSVDESLTSLASDQSTAGAAAQAYATILKDLNITADRGKELFPGYASAVEVLDRNLGQIPGSAGSAKTALDQFLDSTNTKIGYVEAFSSAVQAAQKANDDYATSQGRGSAIYSIKAQYNQTAIADAKAEQQAREGVVSAERSEAAAIRGVETARRQVAEAEHSAEAAARSEAQAEQQLHTLEAGRVQLVKDLAAAYDQAREHLVSLQNQAKDDSLSVEAARFAEADALKAQKLGPQITDFNAPVDPNAQAKLDLAAQQATQSRIEAEQRAQQSTQDLTTARQEGIDQSPEVVAANQAIDDNEAAITAQRQTLTDATYARIQADQAVIDQKDAVVAAEQAKQDAHAATAAAHTAEAEAAKKSRDDQVTAAFEIFAAEQAAAKELGTDALAVEKAWGDMATGAQDYGKDIDATLLATKGFVGYLAPGSPARQILDSWNNALGSASTSAGTFLGQVGQVGNIGVGGSATGSVVNPTPGRPAGGFDQSPVLPPRDQAGHTPRSRDAAGTHIDTVNVNIQTQARTPVEVGNETARILNGRIPG